MNTKPLFYGIGSAPNGHVRWEAQVVTEIMARVAVAPVPVVAFKKLQ